MLLCVVDNLSRVMFWRLWNRHYILILNNCIYCIVLGSEHVLLVVLRFSSFVFDLFALLKRQWLASAMLLTSRWKWECLVTLNNIDICSAIYVCSSMCYSRDFVLLWWCQMNGYISSFEWVMSVCTVVYSLSCWVLRWCHLVWIFNP